MERGEILYEVGFRFTRRSLASPSNAKPIRRLGGQTHCIREYLTHSPRHLRGIEAQCHQESAVAIARQGRVAGKPILLLVEALLRSPRICALQGSPGLQKSQGQCNAVDMDPQRTGH